MRILSVLLLLVPLCSAAHAQAPAREVPGAVPLTFSVTLPVDRPALSPRNLLIQTGAGMLGGFAGAVVGTIPLMFGGGGSPVQEATILGLIGAAYIAGTTAGIHHAGRLQGTTANPWATGGGVLAGLAVSGAMMQPFINDAGEAEGPAPLLAFIVPSMGGTAGYAMTRRAR